MTTTATALDDVIAQYESELVRFPDSAEFTQMTLNELRLAKLQPSPPQPTDDGLRRWEPFGFYACHACTCLPTCDDPCKGDCGCEACDAAYQDYLSGPSD